MVVVRWGGEGEVRCGGGASRVGSRRRRNLTPIALPAPASPRRRLRLPASQTPRPLSRVQCDSARSSASPERGQAGSKAGRDRARSVCRACSLPRGARASAATPPHRPRPAARTTTVRARSRANPLRADTPASAEEQRRRQALSGARLSFHASLQNQKKHSLKPVAQHDDQRQALARLVRTGGSFGGLGRGEGGETVSAQDRAAARGRVGFWRLAASIARRHRGAQVGHTGQRMGGQGGGQKGRCVGRRGGRQRRPDA